VYDGSGVDLRSLTSGTWIGTWAIAYEQKDGTQRDVENVPCEAVRGTVQDRWYATANLYKVWAREQSWTRASSGKHVPAWLSDEAIMMSFAPTGR